MADVSIEFDDGTVASVEVTDLVADAISVAIERMIQRRMDVKG